MAFNKKQDFVFKVLGITFFSIVIVFGISLFAINLKERIKDKTELKELQKEILRLEIQLLKRDSAQNSKRL